MSVISVIDQTIVLALNNFVSSYAWLGATVSALAVYGVYVIPLVWIVWWFVAGKKQRHALMSSMLSGLVAWQILNRIVKAFLDLHGRPMDELAVKALPVKEFLFNRPGESFPSDHAAFLFGISLFFLLLGQRKPGVWMLVVAVLVSLARIAMAAHYPSDIVASAITGLVAAWLISIIHHTLSETLWEKLIAIARKLRLA